MRVLDIRALALKALGIGRKIGWFGVAAKRSAERLDCYIYGISRKNAVESVAVYVGGKSVRLSGPNHYQHHVHPSNVGSLEGWKKEIILVFHLTDLVVVSADMLNSETHKAAMEKLKAEAAKR